jgi:hypothetical protein
MKIVCVVCIHSLERKKTIRRVRIISKLIFKTFLLKILYNIKIVRKTKYKFRWSKLKADLFRKGA